MPLGLALISVEKGNQSENFKGLLASSYPKEFNISRVLIQKLISIIHLPENQREAFLELKYNDKIIIVLVKDFQDIEEKELIIAILSPDEGSKTKEYSDLMLDTANTFYLQSKKDRFLKFEEFAQKFYLQQKSKKLLFIGFPAAGKTCIKKTFFDGVDPQILLGRDAPEPTRGLAHFVYSWLDAEVGIVDSSGQEFDSFVSPENSFERSIAFEESDVIIYVFDITNWRESQAEVIENLKKVVSTRNLLVSRSQIYAFCHKIDLLEGTNKEKAESFLSIKSQLEAEFGIKTIFTSIQPEIIHTLFRSMQIILNDLSSVGNSIEAFCEDVIKDQSRCAIFLLSGSNLVISQKSTPDLNLDEMSVIIDLVKNQQNILKKTPKFGELDYSVIHTQNRMALIVKSVSILKYGVTTVAFISEDVSSKTLTDLLEKLDKRLSYEIHTSATNVSEE